MALALICIAWLHLGTLVLTTMFGYFAIRRFSFGGRKWLGVILYLVVVVAIFTGLFYFSRQAYITFPKIANTTIPVVADMAAKQGFELPFTDFESFRIVVLEQIGEKFGNFGRYAGGMVVQFALLIIGLVVAVSMFLNSKWEMDDDPLMPKNNLYASVVSELTIRFRTFYESFAIVVGAQIIISTFNAVFTAVFLVWNDFPYLLVLIVATFLCGLLPIIGNIMSNTLIVGVGLTISPKLAIIALLYLVVIHKLEYFLNSKIIGNRIKNPMWLTLIGIVVGEKLMGIPGMILAPVVLHYIKTEASRNRVELIAPSSTEMQVK